MHKERKIRECQSDRQILADIESIYANFLHINQGPVDKEFSVRELKKISMFLYSKTIKAKIVKQFRRLFIYLTNLESLF